LNVRFELEQNALHLVLPNGERAVRYVELKAKMEDTERENERLRGLLREKGIDF
jgi:hypothetical protein